MNRLLAIGFEFAGRWHVDNDTLCVELIRHASQRNILYAFVTSAEVKYVGKTVKTLTQRMAQYRNPAVSQSTNVKNNRYIWEVLRSGASVDILALPDNGLLHFGQFHINLAAGLEDSIIEILKPEWNGRRLAASAPLLKEIDQLDAESAALVDSFEFVMQPTYYQKGFFNVPVAADTLIGGHREKIEIYLGDSSHACIGWIDRKANTNGTPRIMGGIQLRDWFQGHLCLNQNVRVEVPSPYEIRIRRD
jgi:hypothetical protein